MAVFSNAFILGHSDSSRESEDVRIEIILITGKILESTLSKPGTQDFYPTDTQLYTCLRLKSISYSGCQIR